MRFRCWKYGSRTCEKRRARFLTCAGVICSIKRKRWYCAISELISHLNLALRCTPTSDRKASQKRSLRDRETAWPGELKDSFFDLCWGDSRCQKRAPGFTKKLYNFGAVLKVSLQFSYNTRSKPWFWSDRETAGPDRFTKPIFCTKRTPPNEETAWPGQFNGSIFDIHVTPPRCQTIAVKFWFCFCDNVTPKPLRCV